MKKKLKSNKKNPFAITILLAILITILYLNPSSTKDYELNETTTTSDLDDLFHFDALTDYDNIRELNKLIRKVVDVFNANNLTYWSNGGTLLGAVKDKGTIPWDDDADLCLFESDLDNFLSLESEFNASGIGLTTHDCFFKLFDLNGKQLNDCKYKYPFVDVFVYHRVSDRMNLKNIKTNSSDDSDYFKNDYFLYKDIYPVRNYTYEDYFISGPYNPFEYLDRAFTNWTHVGRAARHVKNKLNDQTKSFPIYYFNLTRNQTFLWLSSRDNFRLENNDALLDIVDLSTANLSDYIPELDGISLNYLVRQSAIKFILLYKFGGIYLDTSRFQQIVDLNFVLDKLKKYEFVGLDSQVASYFMAARPKRILMERVLKRLFRISKINAKLDSNDLSDLVLAKEISLLVKEFNYEYFDLSQFRLT